MSRRIIPERTLYTCDRCHREGEASTASIFDPCPVEIEHLSFRGNRHTRHLCVECTDQLRIWMGSASEADGINRGVRALRDAVKLRSTPLTVREQARWALREMGLEETAR